MSSVYWTTFSKRFCWHEILYVKVWQQTNLFLWTLVHFQTFFHRCGIKASLAQSTVDKKVLQHLWMEEKSFRNQPQWQDKKGFVLLTIMLDQEKNSIHETIPALTGAFEKAERKPKWPVRRSALVSAWLWGRLHKSSPCLLESPHTAAHWERDCAGLHPELLGMREGQPQGQSSTERRKR